MVERGPGVDREQWANGMRPKTPPLTEEAPEWEAKEVFWLVKHGAKMTGMPAFGPTHDEETLWGIVAMVKELPAMTPDVMQPLVSNMARLDLTVTDTRRNILWRCRIGVSLR